MSSTHIIVHGSSGRMGSRICALIGETPGCVLHAAIGRAGGALAALPETRSVIIDFSSPQGTLSASELALQHRTPILVGTTGLENTALEALKRVSKSVGVLVAPNTSLGVAVLADAATRVARLLGAGYQASIVEAHHIHKKDAPSGTAKRLASAVRAGGGDLQENQILAIRGGDVVGEHTIRFAGPGEYVELVHRAVSRDLFARGAIKAAVWLSTARPGWHTIEDVLGLTK